MEKWKEIEGYEGLYEVSDCGNIKSLKKFNRMSKKIADTGYFRQEKQLSKIKNKNGYIQVSLSKNGIVKNFLVHRLVAKAFIPNPNSYKCINHKDENPANNNVENLEWCTVQYNNKYGTKNIRTSETLKKKINQYDLDGNFIKQWGSATDVAKELNVPRTHISSCTNNKRKTSGGFIWKKGREETIIEIKGV